MGEQVGFGRGEVGRCGAAWRTTSDGLHHAPVPRRRSSAPTTPRLDDKGRLFLPAKFRERLAGGLVITPGQERCLYVFPDAEFARLFERHPAGAGHQQGGPRLPADVPGPRLAPRRPDKQGRVTVPPDLRTTPG